MRKGILYIAIASLATSLHAQNDASAVTGYKPNLMEAHKLLIDPRVPQNTSSEIKLSYNPAEFVFKTKPAVSLAEPTRYVDPALDTSYNPNYVRLGIGNYGSKLGEIYMANRANSKYAYGLAFQHNSADEKGTLRDYSSNRGIVWGSRFFGRSSLTTALNYQRDMNRFFGKDSITKNDLDNQAKKIGSSIGGLVNYDLKAVDNKPGASFGINFNNYHNSLNQSELEYGAKLGWDVKVSEIKLQGDLSYTQLNYRQVFKTKYQSIISANPKVRFVNKENQVDAIAGINFAYVFGVKDPYIAPILHAEKKLEGLKALAYAGVNGGLQLNSVRRYAQSVPFTFDSLNILNSYELIRGYVGLKGRIIENSQFAIEVGGNQVEDMPLIVVNNDSINSSNLIYDNVNNLWFRGDVRFGVGEKLRFGGKFKINNYSVKSQLHAWNLPNGEYGAMVQYLLKKSLVFELGADGIGNYYAHKYVSRETYKQKGFADIHARVDYKFKNIARLWIAGSNLLNNQYQRYYAYKSYGTTIMGGISASF